MEVAKNDSVEGSNNLPAVQNSTELVIVEQEVKEMSFMDSAREAALMSLVEGILPKIKPFIDPAVKKLEEYFGDDSKMFLIRRTKGKAAQVIVLDNTKGSYLISNEIFDSSLNPAYLPKEGETDEAQTQRLINEAAFKAQEDLKARIAQIKNRKNEGRKKAFEAEEVAVINVHATDIFIQKLLSGEFTTQK